MKAIEMKDLFAYRFLSGVCAAPAGERAVFVVKQAREESNDYSSDIYLYDEGSVRRMTADGKSGGPLWEDEEHLLFPAMREKKDQERAKNGERFSVWYRLNIHGGEAERAFELPVPCDQLYRLNKETFFFVSSIDRENPDEYAMTAEERKALQEKRKENEDYHILTDGTYRMNGAGFQEGMGGALFLLNSQTGKTQRVSPAEQNVFFAEKLNSTVVYVSAPYGKTECLHPQLYRYDPQTDQTDCLYAGKEYEFGGICALGDTLIALAADGKKAGLNQNLAVYRVENGGLTLLCDPDVGFGSSVGSDCRLGGGECLRVYRDELYFTCTVGGSTQLRKVDAQGRMAVINRRSGSLDCFDITQKGTVLGIGLYKMRLQELYAIGRGQTVRALTSFNTAALEDCYVALPQRLSVRSHGRRIDGWVLLPKDYDPQKTYPAVLDIHGGPKTVYGEVFYHEMQVWAGRGAFVFFCNPTGSDGRGNVFMDIRGKYGTVDYDNLMDFTDEVLKTYPAIDPARVAVTGGSYGGFMTNWIIGHTKRFACAATQRSISNWFSFYCVSDIGPYFAKDQTGGDLFGDANRKKMWFHSPLAYVQNVETPTLFIHSDEDYRCPIDQGLQLYTALLEKGVETRFIWFKGENHELSRSGKPKHRMKRLEEITAWIEKYTAPKA